jgi:endo-beta-N-acetylglucosaminidase D
MKDEMDLEAERLVEDFAKVYNAFSKAPKGKEDEALDKALDEVWARREKEAEQKQGEKK